MNPVTWSFPTTIVFGSGALATLADHVKRIGAKRVLVVCDAGVAKVGIAERVRALLAEKAEVLWQQIEPRMGGNHTAG